MKVNPGFYKVIKQTSWFIPELNVGEIIYVSNVEDCPNEEVKKGSRESIKKRIDSPVIAIILNKNLERLRNNSWSWHIYEESDLKCLEPLHKEFNDKLDKLLGE